MGFAAMLADEQILIFLFAISSGSVRPNSVGLLVVNLYFYFFMGFSSGLDKQQCQPAQIPVR